MKERNLHVTDVCNYGIALIPIYRNLRYAVIFRYTETRVRYGNIITFASLRYKDWYLIVLNELNMAEIPSKLL